MWINLQPDQLLLIQETLAVSLLMDGDTSKELALMTFIDDWKKNARSDLHKRYFQAAVEAYHRDGETEVTEEGDDTVMVSPSDDGGAYVMAWVWVSDDEADICPECGDFPGSDTYGTVGDGFDGLCPSCADKAEESDE